MKIRGMTMQDALDGLDSFLNRLRLVRAHQTCLQIGHHWVALSYTETTGLIRLQCQRCYPHEDSSRTTHLYDPFNAD